MRLCRHAIRTAHPLMSQYLLPRCSSPIIPNLTTGLVQHVQRHASSVPRHAARHGRHTASPSPHRLLLTSRSGRQGRSTPEPDCVPIVKNVLPVGAASPSVPGMCAGDDSQHAIAAAALLAPGLVTARRWVARWVGHWHNGVLSRPGTTGLPNRRFARFAGVNIIDSIDSRLRPLTINHLRLLSTHDWSEPIDHSIVGHRSAHPCSSAASRCPVGR